MTAAYQILGIINEDEIPTAGQYKVALYSLNSMMKELEATGIHVWTEEEGIIFLQMNQRRYLLGGTTTARACDATMWTQAALLVSCAANSTVLTLSSNAGMAVGDNFGIVQNDWSVFELLGPPHSRGQWRRDHHPQRRDDAALFGAYPVLQLSYGGPIAASAPGSVCPAIGIFSRHSAGGRRRPGLERNHHAFSPHDGAAGFLQPSAAQQSRPHQPSLLRPGPRPGRDVGLEHVAERPVRIALHLLQAHRGLHRPVEHGGPATGVEQRAHLDPGQGIGPALFGSGGTTLRPG